jgi:hypothetical protein
MRQDVPDKFRKKEKIVEAMQWDGSYLSEDPIFKFTGRSPDQLFLAKKGDWIVKTDYGHFRVYRPDIFEALYERVEDT